MRTRRAIGLLLLAAFVSGFGLPWLAPDHRFNDDIDGEFIPAGTGSAVATLRQPASDTTDHCVVCHWLRALRTVSRPAASTAFQFVVSVTHTAAARPDLRSITLPVVGARGPPASAL